MRRGGAIVAAIASTLVAGASVAHAAGAPPIAPRGVPEATAEQLGVQAYEYGIPLMEFLRQAASWPPLLSR